MGFKEWQQENQELAAPKLQSPATSGFDKWKKEISNDYTPDTREDIKDLAYDKYRSSVARLGGGEGFTRESFKSTGEADKWIDSGALRTERNHGQKMKESYSRGKSNFLVNQNYFKAAMLGEGNADEVYKDWKRQRATDAADPIEGNFFTKLEYATARILPGMIEGGKQALPLVTAAGGVAVVAGNVSPLVVAPEEFITVPAAMGVGFKVGSTYAWYQQGAGEMLLNAREMGFDDKSSKVIAGIAALPYALIEQVQVGQVTPGLRQAANKTFSKSITKVMGVAAKKYGKTLLSESLEEVAQESVMIIAGDMTKLFHDQGIDISKEEVQAKAWRLWETFKESGKAMALMPIPGAMVDIQTGVSGRKLVANFENAGYDVKQSESMADKVSRGVTLEDAHRSTVHETVADRHNSDGGATILKRTGRPATKGFPVGIGETKVINKKVITPADVALFETEHAESLAFPGREVGTWYDEENNSTNLDVVQIEDNLESAMEVGKKYGERYVFDIGTGECIKVDNDVNPDAAPAQTMSETLKERENLERSVKQIPEPSKEQIKGQAYGLTSDETLQRLDNAELRYKKLSNKDQNKLSSYEKTELNFLSKNRKNFNSLMDWDTKPKKYGDMNAREATKEGHMIPEQLGWSESERQDFNASITGLTSMRDMSAVQKRQVAYALRRIAKRAGIDIGALSEASPVTEMTLKLEERKQKPRLTRRDARNMSTLRKWYYTAKAGVSRYFLNSTRIKRLCRSLDNYEEDGPFSKNIYKRVKNADVKSITEFNKVMEAMKSSIEDMGINAAKMMDEVLDIGIKDKLTTSERVGIYALAQNKKTYNHLLSEFSEEEIKVIVESVDEDGKLVAGQVQAYFETGYPEFQAAARVAGVTDMIKEENYITAFLVDRDDVGDTDFMEGLTSSIGAGTKLPGKQMTIARKPGAKRNLELDVFVIQARAARALERFKVMAPVAKSVGGMLNNDSFRNGLNNATYGYGAKVMDQWLQDSVRGSSAYNPTLISNTIRTLRLSGINFVLGFKVLTAAKQGGSFLTAMGAHPAMIPAMFDTMVKMAKPGGYKAMDDYVNSKSDLMKTRDWNRDLRQAWNKKSIRKLYAGKSLSPMAMKMAMYIDRHVVVAAWNSAYNVSQSQGMNEKDSVAYADGVIEDTQPMGKAVDLPTFFRGGELEKTLTVFQNQINQNGNYLWYNILGEAKAKKINLTTVGYRTLTTQVLPALLLGMISRGRPPKDAKEVALDLFSYVTSPFVFIGRWAYNTLSGEWGGSRNIAEEPFVEAGRLAKAIKKGDKKAILKYSARTFGAWSNGKIPLQAIVAAEGAWDLSTGETKDFRELVWSKQALERNKKTSKDHRKGFSY